jgi:adenylylsulfate kinase-like enzyme
MIYLITGKRNAGKTHFAKALAKELDELQEEVIHIDGDAFRKEMGNYDFSDDGRILNLSKASTAI